MHKPKVYRSAVGAMFFMAGVCFSSWASRIATIQEKHGLNEAQLGTVLFAIPVGLMISLPIASWAIAKVGSRLVLAVALTLYALTLIALGFAPNVFTLTACLVVFGLGSNAVNVSVNTQAVATEAMYPKPILASFHGLWSLAGFLGAGVGTLMIGQEVSPQVHFIIMTCIIIASIFVSWRYLHNDKQPVSGGGKVFVMPDKSLIILGLIAFCSMVVEGAMFDWTTIYFKKAVGATKAWEGAGYTAGMCFMAAGRFVADGFSHRFGLKRTLQVSGALSMVGLLVAVLFPQLVPAIIGFMFVGAGISSVVPMIYSAAGRSTTMQPGAAIAAVSTISFVGFLIGPPVIGILAEIFSLRISFTFLALMAALVVVFTSRAKI
jgi:MFS family permease